MKEKKGGHQNDSQRAEKEVEILESIGQGDLKISVEDEYGFDWGAKEVVVFDNKAVIERGE